MLHPAPALKGISQHNARTQNGDSSSVDAHKKISYPCPERQNYRCFFGACDLNLSRKRKSDFCWVVVNLCASSMLSVTSTDITVWVTSALLAIGIGLSKYAKWRTRDKLVRELAAMDPERREKLLSRMRPDLAMEARQELMRRFHIS